MTTLTFIHIAGGTLALVAGALAATFAKGSRSHKQSGLLFVVSMLVMALPAGLMSYEIGKPFDILSSILTCYFVLTGYVAFRPVNGWNHTLTLAGGLCMLSYIAVELHTFTTGTRATDAPVGAGYIFAFLLALGVWGDLRHARGANTFSRTRKRHLWRMNIGLFMATANIFGVRPHLFPEWMQSSGILVALAFAPLIAMIWWLFALRGKSQ